VPAPRGPAASTGAAGAGQLLGKAEAAVLTFGVATPAVALWRHRHRVAAVAARLARLARSVTAHHRRTPSPSCGAPVRYYITASGPKVREAMRRGQLGQIITPVSGNRVIPGVDWIADNAAYTGVLWNQICQVCGRMSPPGY
jgi:hypothetical protein